MELTITASANQRLKSVLGTQTTFLLVLNDGSNQFSSAEGCCMIGDRFLIVPTTEKIEPFTLPITNSDYTIHTSTYETMFLKGNLVLDLNPSSGTLVLKNESGILDNNLLIKNASGT